MLRKSVDLSLGLGIVQNWRTSLAMYCSLRKYMTQPGSLSVPLLLWDLIWSTGRRYETPPVAFRCVDTILDPDPN